MKPNFGKLGGLEHCGEQSRVVVGVHRSSQSRRKDTVALLPFASRPLSFLILGLAMAQQSHQAQLRYAEFRFARSLFGSDRRTSSSIPNLNGIQD